MQSLPSVLQTPIQTNQQTPTYVPLNVPSNRRNIVAVKCDDCGCIPIIGCFAAIPRIFACVIVNSGFCVRSSLTGCPNDECVYVAARACDEGERGCVECVPFGSRYFDHFNKKYEENGFLPPSAFGKVVYRDPDNGVVYSETEHEIYGWIKREMFAGSTVEDHRFFALTKLLSNTEIINFDREFIISSRTPYREAPQAMLQPPTEQKMG